MLKRRLGRTNFQASVVGLGGIPIQWRPRNEAIAVVRRAIELGVNFVDTATSYGDSEQKIGEAMKGLRDRVFIATKSHHRDRRALAGSIAQSRRRLGVETLDLFLLHGVDSHADLEGCLGRGGALEVVKEARGRGEIRFVGLSGHHNDVLARAIETGEFDVVVASYNLTNDDAALDLLPLAQRLDVGVVVMKPLAGGSLAVPPEALRLQAAQRAVATAQAALRFVLSNPRITTAIPGMGRLSEVEENVPLGHAEQRMSAAEVEALKMRARSLGFTFCQGCGYCLPECPQEINIQEVFRLLAFHDNYGMIDYARTTYRESYEEEVKLCTDCRACLERCPASLEIPGLLRQADARLGSGS